ncbi:hypothetical protein [Niabella soli]|uniref:Uncharacterized protein n=1 Tax=Niabella soli DSM 19437 TaxID=929713 RepID=W0F861_9BACT|nr:hypothetical protein [Niabella soli]AHF17561.1 hypothetical protein NIASO_09915 [Niabella soli DSM 19437]
MQTNAKGKAKILLVAGVVALLTSYYLKYKNERTATHNENTEIAAGNQNGVSESEIRSFLIGMGTVLVIGGIYLIAKSSRNSS